MQEKIILDSKMKEVILSLSENKSILIPTDTVYGLIADGLSIEAMENLYQIKKRPIEKTFAVFVHFEDIGRYCEKNSREQRLFERFLGVTFVIKNVNQKLKHLEVNGKIGIRIPNSKTILELLKVYEKPLIATSANLSGEKTPSNFDEVSKEIINHPLVFSDETQKYFKCAGGGIASSIFDISEEKIRVIREGLIKLSDIENFLVDV